MREERERESGIAEVSGTHFHVLSSSQLSSVSGRHEGSKAGIDVFPFKFGSLCVWARHNMDHQVLIRC